MWGDGSREGGGEIGRCGEGRWSGDRGGVGRGEAGRREIRRARGIVLVLQVHSAPLKKCFDDISPLGLLGSKPIGSSKKINFLEITTIGATIVLQVQRTMNKEERFWGGMGLLNK